MAGITAVVVATMRVVMEIVTNPVRLPTLPEEEQHRACVGWRDGASCEIAH